MICNNCGKQIMDNAAACPYCGIQFRAPQVGQSGVLRQQQPQTTGYNAQQEYYEPQQEYYEPQQEYYEPQQEYYDQQQEYYDPQQEYYNPQQEYYNPQQNYYPQQPNYGTNDSPVGFIILLTVIMLLIATEVILFLAPGVLTKKYRGNKIAAAGDKKIEELSGQTTEGTTEATTQAVTDATTEMTTEAISETTTEMTTEMTTEATTEATTEMSAADMAAAYSTTTRPDLSEFDWYVNDVMINGIWTDAKQITDPLGYEGGWKCFCFWDPDNVMDAYGKEWCNASISVANGNVAFTFDYYMVQWANEAPFDISGQTITYTGELSENGIYCSDDNGSLEIYGFYSYGDKEYAVGFLIAPSGEWANIALVRP